MRIPLFRPHSVLIMTALAAALLAACGGDDRDETEPLLTIESQIESPRIDPNVTLSGDVEPGALVEVTQTTAAEAGRTISLIDPSAPASGTWSASVSLDPGSNQITVMAIDEEENSRSITMTIVLADVILTPSSGATDIPLDAVITAEFRKPVTAPPAESFKLFLLADPANVLPASISFDPSTPTVATLTPVDGLSPGTTYQAVISPSTAKITDEAEAEIAEASVIFTTAAQ